jgi:hypothetical protein
MAQVQQDEEEHLEDQEILAELPENAPVFEDARKYSILLTFISTAYSRLLF